MKFKANGHEWKWTRLSEERGSLLCLDPVKDEHGIDQSSWPTDEQIGAAVELPVRFTGPGEHPDFPEGIFELI